MSRSRFPSPKVEMKDHHMYVHVVLEADPINIMNPEFMKFLENNRIKLEQWGVVVYQGIISPPEIDITGANAKAPQEPNPAMFFSRKRPE